MNNKHLILPSFLLSIATTVSAYDVNFIDATSLNSLYDAQSSVVKNVLNLNDKTAWSSIETYSAVKDESIIGESLPLYEPLNGFTVETGLGLNGGKTGIVTLDLSQYGIKKAGGSLIIPSNFQLLFTKTVDLSNTNLGSFDGITASKSLVHLKLNNNRISSLPNSIGEIATKLETLELRNNNLSKSFVQYVKSGTGLIFKLTNIKRLDISNNQIGGGVYADFQFFPDAEYIDISCNGFSGGLFSSDPTQAARIAKKITDRGTKFIATAQNCLDGKTPNNFTNVAAMKNAGITFGAISDIPNVGGNPVEPEKIDGTCSSVKPTFEVVANDKSNAKCERGTVGKVTYSATSKAWTWSCLGQNGGSNALNCTSAAVPDDNQSAQCEPINVDMACSKVSFDVIKTNLNNPTELAKLLCNDKYLPVAHAKLLDKTLTQVESYLSPVQSKKGDYSGQIDSYEYTCQGTDTSTTPLQSVKCSIDVQ